ncbi:MAG: fibronectin type III domain-containing protein [Candidatus Aenigmarchaeota archaeon]|nr:fibronectin type III domain-containing protein [Candidatus Aenigmarchaeota archaeon]
MNKTRIFSVHGAVLVMLLALSAPVFAGAVIQGDMPNAITRTVEVYNDTQSSPCDGSADGGSALLITGSGTGDSSYDDDNDYNVTANLSTGTQWSYIYFCDGTSRITNLTKYTSNTSSYNIDLADVKDDGNGVHAALNNDYVFVCNNLEGTQLDTVSVQINTASATDYQQFYPVDEQNTTVAYVFFDDDTTSPCLFDNTKTAGKRINVTRSAENYGVLVQWSPEQRAVGDLHHDLDDAVFHLFDSNGVSIGMLNQSLNASADGQDDADDDYTLYYDNPASGALTLNITPSGTAISAASILTVTNIANNFATGYDFIHAIKNTTGGIADDITHVRVHLNVTSTGITLSTPTVVSGSVMVYNLYTDVGATDTPVLFLINNTVVLNRTRALNFSVTNVGMNVTLSAGRVSGSVAIDLGSGSDDEIAVHNASNTAVCADANTLQILNSHVVNPLTSSSPDYTQYFEADASATYRLRAVRDRTWHSCGNTFTLSNMAASVDLDAEISGVAQANIGRIALDASEGNDMSPGSTDVYSDNFSSGRYYIFSSDSTALSAPMDAAVDVLFAESANQTITVLERDKDVTSGNLSLNVSQVHGFLHLSLNDSSGDVVEVYTDVNTTTRKSNTDNTANSTGRRSTGYTVYFEHDSTLSQHYLRFTDANTTYYSFVKTVVGSGLNQSINLTNLIHGKTPVANDVPGIDIVWLDDDASPTDDAPFFAGDTNVTTGEYQIFHNQTTASYLNADGDNLTSDGVNLSRAFTPSSGNSTFDVARVIGDVHANLQGSANVMRICTTIACTNRTSDNNTPVSLTGTDNDYRLYFEVPLAGTTEVILYVNDSDATVNNYTTYVNISSRAIASISPGNTIRLNLTQQLNGTTPGSLVRLWMRTENGVASGRWNFSADIINGSYRMYHNFTASTQAIQFDENTDETGTNFNYTQNMALKTMINVSEVKGDLPSQFDGDRVEVEENQNQACNGAAYSSDAVSDGGNPDYRVYVEANGTTRYAVFCDGTTRELERSTAANSGAAVHDIDVSRISGSVHPDLLALNQMSNLADNITIHNTSTCVGSALSSEPEQPASDVYAQYYETAAAGTTFYINATAVVNITVGSDFPSFNFTTCAKFTTSGPGTSATINLTALLNGTVHADVFSVVVDNNTDNSTDAFTNVGGGSRTGEYRLYTYTMGNSDFVSAYSLPNALGTRLLNRSVNLLDLMNATLNVSKVNGTLHTDLANTASGDAVRLYSDALCGTQISSEDLITAASTNFTQYYAWPNGGGTLYMSVVDDNVFNNYTTCINTEVVMDTAGGSVAYNLTVKVNGTLANGLTQIYLDNDGNSANWEVNATVVTATAPDTFVAYFNGSSDTDVNFTSDSTTSQLVRTAKNFAPVGGSASTNFTFNVSSVTGEAHTDLEGVDDNVTVWDSNTCAVNRLSSEPEHPSDASGVDYTQYFEGQDGTTYYANVTFGDGTNVYSTCMRAGFTLSSNTNASVGFDRKLSGEVPDLSNAVLTTDILSVGADVEGSTAIDYLAIVADNGTDSLYRMYVNSTHGGSGDMVNFYSDIASTLRLNKTKSLASDLEVNVSVVYGETHEDLEAAGNTIFVCDEIASFSSFGVCGTVAHSTILEEPSNNKYTSANDFEVFFEQEDGDTGYFLQVNDSEGVSQFFSYRNFTSTAGSTVNVSVDGKLMGNVTESYNTALNISDVNVTIKDNGNANVLATTITNNTGTYRLYASVINVVDIRFDKSNYLTKDSVTNGDGATPDLNDVTLSASINTTLDTGVKVIVRDYNTNDLVTDATVRLYNCTSTTVSSCTQTLLLCGAPSGNCQRTGDNTAGSGQNGQYNFANIGNSSYFQIKITRTNYTDIVDPDPASGTGATYQINGSVLPQGLATDYTYFLRPLGAGVPSLSDPNDTAVTADNTPTFSWSSVANTLMYEILVDDASDFSSYNITANVSTTSFTPGTAIADAKYYWKVRAYNSANQSGSWSATRTLTVDVTAPSSATLTRPFAGHNLSGSILINASGADATAGIDRVEFFKNDCGSGPIGNATAQPYEVTWATTAADDGGSRIICARVIDKAGNSLNASAVNITVDNTNPTASVTSPSNGMTINGTWILTTTVSDGSGSGINRVEFYIDGALNFTDTTSTYDFSWVTTLVGDGSHSIKVKAYDNANNSVESSIVSINVDNGAPDSAAITSPANNSVVIGSVDFVVAVSDAIDVKNVTLYNESGVVGTDTSAPWSIAWATTTANDGRRAVWVVVSDNANNTLTSTNLTITVDNTAPTVNIVDPVAMKYRRGGQALNVTYTITEANPSRVVINITNSSTTVGTLTVSSPGSGTRTDVVTLAVNAAEGTYNVTVTVYDSVNQSGTDTEVERVIVDNTVPSASVSSPSNGMTINGTWIITTSVSDTGGSGIQQVEFYIDGALNFTDTTSTYDMSWTTSLTGDGAHSIKVKAYDNAGNTVESSIVSVTVDNTAPQSVAITSPANGSVVTGAVVIIASVADGIAVKNVTFYNETDIIGTDTSAPWSVTWSTSAVNDGTRRIWAVVADTTNNTLASQNMTVTVDNTVPSDISSVEDSGVWDTDGVVTWNWTVPSDGSGSGISYYTVELNSTASGTYAILVANTSSTSYTQSGLVEGGNYSLRVRAVDRAGLTSGFVASNGIRIDITAPTFTFNNNSYGPYNADQGSIVDIDFSDNYQLSFVQYKVNANGTWVNVASSIGAATYATNFNVWSSNNTLEGQNRIYARAQDAAGNNVTSSEFATFTKDTVNPAVVISNPVSGSVLGTNVTLTVLTGETATCTYNITTSTAPSMATTGTTVHEQNLSSLTSGSKTVGVSCTDSAGNNANRSVTWTVDAQSTPTVMNITLGDADRIINGSTTVTLSATNNLYTLSSVYYEIENVRIGNISVATDGTFDEASEDVNFTMAVSSVADGDRTLRVCVNNSQGIAGCNAIVFTLDTVAPAITISAPANATLSDATPTVTFTVQDNVSASKVNVTSIALADSLNGSLGFSGARCDTSDNGRTYNCSFDSSTTLSEGAHTITINASDIAGNQRSSTRTFTMNTTVYVNTINVTADDTTAIPNGYDYWQWTIRVNSSSQNIKFTLANWASGANSISVSGNDMTTITHNSTAYNITTSMATAANITLVDDDSAVAGYQANLTLKQKLPTTTVSGSYSTTYSLQNS